MTDHRIRRVPPDPTLVPALAALTIDCVDGGASIGFMRPLSAERASAFWTSVIEGVARGERVLLVAEDPASGAIDGTVQLLLGTPDNQPHRADVAKMQVHRRARRRGLGEALLHAVEAIAIELGRTLLVLDTVTASDADRLYTKCGWIRVGEIPRYALLPDGTPCATTYFYRDLRND